MNIWADKSPEVQQYRSVKHGKIKNAYVCQNCGYESAKWYGKCPECGQWNTMEEQLKSPAPMAEKPLRQPRW